MVNSWCFFFFLGGGLGYFSRFMIHKGQTTTRVREVPPKLLRRPYRIRELERRNVLKYVPWYPPRHLPNLFVPSSGIIYTLDFLPLLPFPSFPSPPRSLVSWVRFNFLPSSFFHCSCTLISFLSFLSFPSISQRVQPKPSVSCSVPVLSPSLPLTLPLSQPRPFV